MPGYPGMTRPTAVFKPLAKRCALTLGLKLRWATASSTLARFFLETVKTLLITRETVVIETPARAATSSMLIFFLLTVVEILYLTTSPALSGADILMISAAEISFRT